MIQQNTVSRTGHGDGEPRDEDQFSFPEEVKFCAVISCRFNFLQSFARCFFLIFRFFCGNSEGNKVRVYFS